MVDADNDRTVLIDASTAFRVDDEWTYGFPGEYYPFVSEVDGVVMLVRDNIIHRMELQDFYLMNKCVVHGPIIIYAS